MTKVPFLTSVLSNM